MRPTWLIEGNVEGIPTEPLQAEVRRQGMTCRVVKYLPNLARPKDIAGSESLGGVLSVLPALQNIFAIL